MDEPGGFGDARTLRYLKWLVTGLTVTMIVGFITIVVLFAMRFSEMRRVELPDTITLPDGETAAAFTRGNGWFAVVTENDEILVYSAATGNLRQRIKIEPE